MDAFDNPARNGMAGLQRDGASIDQSNGAAAASDLLTATAQVTAAASAMPLAIQAILVPDASGRIILPAGASIDDITVSGTDLIVTLPNGQVLIIPNGAVDVPAIVIDGDTVPASTVAQLLEGLADFNPEAGLRSSGGNFADPEGPIQDAYALGDLLPYTELAFPQPEDRELIPDVPDEEPTVVIVTPDQPAGATAATASVDEAGLPVRGEEPAGSNSAATSETTTGSIVYDAADGLDSLTINGTAITAVGQVVTTPLGQLTITSLEQGSVGYSYTLADNTDAGANLTDLFAVVITDSDGDTATATLTIDIIDDVPIARNDTDQVAPGSFAPETGHVITGAGTTSGSAGADTEGADGASLTGVTAGTGTTFSAPGTAISGQYGTLTLNADGSYSYVRNPNTPGGVSDVFTYRLVDGDGDTSTATLTIAIGDSPNTIDFVPGPGDNTTVDESQLPPRDGESEGSAFDGDDETTTGTITFTSPDGVASVTIEGVIITPDSLPQTVFSDETGTLVITGYNYDPVTGEGSITYDYTLADNALNPGDTSVSFDIVVTDLDGDSASDTLDITIIDDVPTARDDADSVTEDGPLTADGNVLTGSGGNDANTTDGVADTQGADGATVTAVTFGATAGSVGAPLAGAYGTLTLNSDGSYSYALNNAAQPVQGLSAGETLTEIFTYSITDGDGDPATATLTITINGADDGVTITGLDAQGAELTVDEDDLADGSSPDAAALTQTGTFDVSAPDGLGNVTIGGTQVVTDGVFTPGTASSPLGTVNITGFAPVTGADGSVIGGTFTYEYVLDDNTLTHPAEGQDSVTDSFAVVVTDSDGSSANASLDVAIIDDVPAARDDADSVTEDGPLTADGNVLTGGGGGDANMTDGVADTQGADGATVTAVEGGAVGAPFATTYGTLTLNADGSYTYVLNNAAQPVQGLSAGETLTESFEYEIIDGDGDPATATLTITINGADDGVTITGLDAQGAELSVDEDDLPARTGEAPGSDTSPEGVTDGDSFSVSTPDGMGSVVLDSFNGVPLGAPLTLVTADGSFTPQSVATAYGTLSITGFTPVTGADGSVIGGTFTYSYTLADNRTDHPAMGEDDRTDSIGVTVTDIDGSSASDSIDIRITDDVPDAIDDAATQTLENAPVTINVLANDVQGADSVQPSAVELVDGSLTGAGSLVYNGDGSFTYTPAAQETGTVSFQYQITDGDGDTDIATATITLVADSIPQIRNADDVTVDEDGLLGANADDGLPGEVTSTGSASAAGTITVDFGSDIPAVLAGSLVLDDSAALDTQLTVGGVPVTFAKDGDDLVGSVGGSEVIRISLTTATAGPGATEVTYGYSVTLSQAIDQALAGSEDSDLLAGIGFTVTDSDNSTASGSFDVTIVDDLPTLVMSDTPVSAIEGGPAVEGTWSLDPGADGVTLILVTFGSESDTLTLPAGASVVLVQPTGTLTVNADGSFSFLATGNQNQNLAPSATFTLSAVDGDGDPTSDSLTITIDDGADPAGGDTLALTVNEAAIDGIGRTPASDDETDSGTLSFTAGSDTLGNFAFTGVGGLVTTLDGVGIDIFWSLSPDGQTITGSLTDGGPAAITISLTAPASIAPGATDTATVTVTLADNLPHELAMAAQTQSLGSVTVTASDTDGDVATGTVTIDVIDDIPTATAEPLASLDEGATVSGVFDFVEGADGASLTQINGNDVAFNPDGWSDWLDLGAGDLRVRADGSYEFRADGVTLSPVAPITGTFTVTDGDADTATAGFSFQIDDANAPTGGSASAAVDDDGLTGPPAGNPASMVGDLDANLNDDPGDTSEASFTGTLGGSVGDDGAGANGFGFGFGTNTTAVVGLETVSFALVGDVLTATVTATASPDTGRIGTDLFTVEITDPSTGAYVVTLLDNVLHAGGPNEEATDATVAIDYSITDADGSTVPGNILTITFDDDAPTATAEPLASLDEGATVSGTFDFVEGADGASLTQINGNDVSFNPDGWSDWLDLGAGDLRVRADGSYEFRADGVTLSPVAPITGTFTVTDGDADTATAGFSFQIDDANAPTGGSASAAVDDDGLTGPPAGNPASMVGDLDANLNDDPGDTSEASFTGTLGGSVGDDGAGANGFGFGFGTNTTAVVGLETVSFALVGDVLTATVTATASPDTGRIGTDLFTVEITDPSTGAYVVTLLDNVLHAGGPNEEATDATVAIDYSITDADGSTVPGNILTITFDDDAPTARPDTDSIAEDDGFPATGNVVTGADAGSADAPGADGASVTGVAAGTSPTAVTGNVGSALAGSYGSLTLDADGEYSYTLDNSDPAVQALGATETLAETFTYTITDGDGDTSTTTLTITINGTNDAPTIGSATTAVSDEGLPGGLLDTEGSPDTTDLAVRTGTIPVGDVDGDTLTVSIGIPATSLESGGQPIVWDNSDPNLLLGKVGTTTIISVAIDDDGDFTVSLLGPIDHPDTGIEDALELIVPVSVSDGIATVLNPAALTIGLEDDSPIAVAPVGTSLVNVAGASILGSLDIDGDVDDNFGGDGGKVVFTSATIAALEAQDLTSGLDPLTYSISLDGQVLTAEKSNGDDVFIITLQPAGSPDQYQVEIIRPIDAVQDVDFNDGGYDFVGGNGSWAGFTIPGDNDSQDLLLTPMENGVDGGTVNTNANEGGVSGGNSVGGDEAMRVDFVVDLTGSPNNGQDYADLVNQNHAFEAHYNVNGASALFTQTSDSSVRVVARDDVDNDNDVGDGVLDTITSVAISFNGSTLIIDANGVYSVGGHSFTVTFSGGEATVDGVTANTRIAAFTADGYNSIEFHHAGGGTFKIGDFGASVVTNEPVPFTVPVAVVDGDGDTSALADIDIVAESVAPPVVLDLDGDGIEYLSSASGVTFDYAGDGNAVATAWAGPNDGLLAFDANGNGRVDNGSEIVFGGNGLTDLQGVAARFDGNGDGVLDADDADFASFGVWQDANSNGVADDGEFRTLDQAGIVAIDLVSDGEAYTTANGSVHVFGESSYTLADGTIRTVADAAFARTGSVKAQDRPVTAMPLADALVAASLITMAQGAQASERMPTRVLADDEPLLETVDEGAAHANVAETGAGTAAQNPGTEVTPAARAADSATHHADEAFEVVASIADAGYSGWRSEDMTAKDGGSSDALFDAPSATPGAASAMDGLLMLGLAAAEAVAAQAASVSAPDPAASAVLAEVLDEGNAIDRLIDALADSPAIELAHTGNPAFDLAQLLEQKVVPDAAFASPPSTELDLHQMATA